MTSGKHTSQKPFEIFTYRVNSKIHAMTQKKARKGADNIKPD